MRINSCLVDTNILLRITRRSSPESQLIATALAKLASDSTSLFYTQQNIAELWNVMTRPVERNGFGLTAAEAESEVVMIERLMTRLLDNESSYREWRRMIVEHNVAGSQVHDARLVATMHAPHPHAERRGFQTL